MYFKKIKYHFKYILYVCICSMKRKRSLTINYFILWNIFINLFYFNEKKKQSIIKLCFLSVSTYWLNITQYIYIVIPINRTLLHPTNYRSFRDQANTQYDITGSSISRCLKEIGRLFNSNYANPRLVQSENADGKSANFTFQIKIPGKKYIYIESNIYRTMNEKIQNKKWFIFLQFKIIFNNRIIIFNIFRTISLNTNEVK